LNATSEPSDDSHFLVATAGALASAGHLYFYRPKIGQIGSYMDFDSYRYFRRLDLVFDDTYELKEAGCYEEMLISAYTSARSNHRDWSTSVIHDMFLRADRSKLAIADGGKPLPPGEYTIYRGVCGTGRLRRVRGLSWSLNLDVACWFADRFSCIAGNPAVYVAKVRAEDVLWASGTDTPNDEREIIVLPAKIKRMALTIQELKAGQDRYASRLSNREKQLVAA
jgi:hypothetical protein